MSLEKSNVSDVPEIYSAFLLLGLVNKIAPSDAAQQGNTTILQFTIPAATEPFNCITQPNPYRKKFVIVNLDPVNTVFIYRKTKEGNVFRLPVPPNFGTISFDTIKRGVVSSCVNGIEIQQELLQCEFMDALIMSNLNAAPVDIVIYEAV